MKLAIVGSSHVGAVRQAAPRVLADYPTVEIAWFALPGAPFRRMQVDEGGVLRIRDATPGDHQVSRKVNGDVCLDLAPFDRIWVIGNRFGFGRIVRLFLEQDVLEWPRTGRPRGMSLAFGARVLETLVEEACARIEGRFGRDPRLVVTPAPYFSETALTEGEGADKWMSKIFVHPHAARIEAMFETAIRERLAARGMGFMAQPQDTRARHMATGAEFSRDARDFRDTGRRLTDLRHMNAAFGAKLFRAFAELHLAGR